MHSSNIETKKKYEIEGLLKFFKDRSKKISKAFSNEVLEINTIRSTSVVSDTQEFSFKLKLLTEVNPNTILPQIKHLIDFFKICLSQEKNFTANIKVPKESEELHNNYHKANKTVEEFISNAPIQILLQGITITLQTNVKNINLDGLQQIEIFLNEQLKHAEKAKNEDTTRNLVSQEIERDIGQTRSHTDYFKANRKKKSKKQAKELLQEEKQSIIKQAQLDARVAMIDNVAEHKRKKLDEIFVEVVSEYKNQDSEIFHNIFNSIFNIVYFQDKQLYEILGPDEISEVLEVLKRPQPPNNSLLGKEYLQKQVYRKKEQLIKLVSGQPSPQPKNVSHEILPSKAVDPLLEINKPTDITLKSSLKTVFSSKETYFCLFLVAASISALCLWHLPLGKVSILKELVPTEKRESIGLTLNIGLPILITLCVLNLAYFLYSEYSVESIEQISKKVCAPNK
ncbi:hypothetical protein WSTR_04025 [Wolbachia endosymbiont of Laodelphax striatellus]|uniref:hypothetical protein n=1 Tax=Wolbachia endosymbiont of Laodelphax striatellus TaxID=368602 RepID=UPI0007C53A58|nr:hypothetical protein [Wolbachia endosymbiont of Laodelphax striatellus]OAB81679.1 hypothetical protein WSTR_04025 [Wolbachia endosymbiont of Laodelphax striatellus]